MTEPIPSRPPIARAARAAAFFGAGLLLAAAAIGRLVPTSANRQVQAKLRFFARNKDSYTSLFIGDSRIFRDIVPARFDETLRSGGEQSLSFNMGVPGMDVFEAYYLLERIAEMRPKNLRYVFFGTHTSFLTDEIDEISDRDVYWRTPEVTAEIVLAALQGGSGWRGQVLLDAVRLGAYRALNRGRLTAQFDYSGDAFFADRLKLLDLPGRQGYFPLELDEWTDFVKMHEEFVSRGPDGFQTALADWKIADPSTSNPKFPAQRRGYESVARLAKGAGWKLVFLRGVFDLRRPATGCETPSADCALIDFSDTKRYGEFYRYRRFYDATHLTADAALDFTTLVARRFRALGALRGRP